MHAQLIPNDGGEPIPITKKITLVGRKRSLCEIVVDRSSVSKLHCAIIKTDGLLFIRDLGSTNGTRVNGQRVVRGALLPGDELAFSSLKFRVQLGRRDEENQNQPVQQNEATEALTPGDNALPNELSALPRDDRSSDSDVRLISEDSSL